MMGWECDLDRLYRKHIAAYVPVAVFGLNSNVLTFRNLVSLFGWSALVRGESPSSPRWGDHKVREFRLKYPTVDFSDKVGFIKSLGDIAEWFGTQKDGGGGGGYAKRLLMTYLERIEYDDDQPLRFFPFSARDTNASARIIVIDPRVRFGRPVLAERGIPTAAISGRHQAGDSIKDIADDFELADGDVEEALRFEAGAWYCEC
jgi:uncharacterized protein (DUF433 family)